VTSLPERVQVMAQMDASHPYRRRIARRVLLGRAEDCHVSIEDEYMSPYHAYAVQLDDGSVQIADCGSTNGTFVNRNRALLGAWVALHPGDVVRMGRTELPWQD
jgi:predicted component of type VI protein secretion system